MANLTSFAASAVVPSDRASSRESDSHRPPGRSAHVPLRVLAAEDDEFNALLIEKCLERQGHRVSVARNGRDALRRLNVATEPAPTAPGSVPVATSYDLLLLDLHMPELDGFTVIRRIRLSERTAGVRLPVIALTARSRPEDRERCLAAGIDEVLVKPFRIAELKAAIDRLAPIASAFDRRVCGLNGETSEA